MSDQINDSLVRRIEAAIADAGVSRSAVEHDWPDCHKPKCQGRHPDPDSAFATMKIQILKAVSDELRYQSTTRPDVSHDDTDGNPEARAVYTLATLLGRYNVHDAGTFVKAARLIVDAYPALIPILGEQA